MSTEITKTNNVGNSVALSEVTNEQISKYLKSMGSGLTADNRDKFIEIAKSFNLNPFKKEIYGIQYGSKFNIIIGYEVYLKRAERTGKLAGWKAWTEVIDGELVAKIEIARKDWTMPFQHEVYFSEYNAGTAIWKSKARTMIKKVVIGQGMRLAFPDELGGLPYCAEEMEVVQTVENIEVEDRSQEADENSMNKLRDLIDNGLVSDKLANNYMQKLNANTPSQEDCEKGIAHLTGVIKKAEKEIEAQESAEGEEIPGL